METSYKAARINDIGFRYISLIEDGYMPVEEGVKDEK